MQHECKITVIDKKCFTDYQEQYLADPKSGPCPFFNVGDEFVLKRTPQQDGKHYKLTYHGDPRYLVTVGKTPSDNRSGSNTAAAIIKTML